MGIEARSAAMTATVAVWLTILLVRAVERRALGWWALYAGIAGIGVLLNIYVALLVIAHGVTLLLASRRLAHPLRLLGTWSISAVVAAALSFPVDRLTLAQTGQLPFKSTQLEGTLNTLVFEQYFSGATPTVGRGIPIPPTSVWSIAVILAATLGWMMIIAPTIWRYFRPVPRPALILGFRGILVPWIVLPTALVIGYSAFVHPMYSGRYFAFTTPAVALLIGASVSALRLPWMRLASIGLLALLIVPVYVSQRGPTSKNGTDWQQAAAVLQANAQPGQDIYYGPAHDGSQVSMHKLSQAYPALLSSLHDISMRETPIQDASLWDRNWPLTHSRATLRTTPVLWAVMEHPGEEFLSMTKQESYIERQGLTLVHDWRGPETDVLEFTRG
jgi:mannosyltransferase